MLSDRYDAVSHSGKVSEVLDNDTAVNPLFRKALFSVVSASTGSDTRLLDGKSLSNRCHQCLEPISDCTVSSVAQIMILWLAILCRIEGSISVSVETTWRPEYGRNNYGEITTTNCCRWNTNMIQKMCSHASSVWAVTVAGWQHRMPHLLLW